MAVAAPLTRRTAPAPEEPGPTGTTITGTLVLVVLAGMALLDRPFGLVGVPGVPLYITEIVLAVAVVELLVRRDPLRGWGRSRWLAPAMVLVYLAWGAVRFATSLGNPILDVVRDSALTYYALFALVAYALMGIDRRFRPSELLRLYGRFVPVLLAVAPLRLVFSSVPSLKELPPLVPGSDVPLLGGHRPGNLGVQVALAVVFLASNGRRDRWTVIGIVTGLLTILLAATQNRGGFLSAALVIAVAIVLWGRRVRFRWLATLAVLACLLVLAWGLDLRIQSGQRDISASQLVENVESLVRDDPAASSQLSDTEDFRSELWTLVLDETIRTDRLENGWGFGPNLGARFLPTHEDQALRNPHNSHLTVLARLGVVGLLIWVVLLLSWFRRVAGSALAARRRHDRAPERTRLAMLGSAVVAGMLLNAFFDPTLETPMVATWLWSVIGLGIGLLLERDRDAEAGRAADSAERSTR